VTGTNARTRASVGAAIIAILAGACSPGQSAGGGVDRASVSTSGEPATVSGLPEWEPRSTLYIPRDDFATAVIGDEIWVFGGMSGGRGTRLESIEVYDTRTDRWRMSDLTMPEGLASFEGAAIGDKVYLFGGLDADSSPSDFSAVLDTSTGRWRKLPPLPTARYAHTVTLHDGRIYAIGGESVEGAVEAVDVFDPRTETWSTGTPMPNARGSHDAVSAGNLVYVLGGWLDAGPSDLVQTYDPTSGRWGSAEPLPEPVSRAGAAVLDGRLWVSYHRFSSVLDLGEGTWSAANPLTISRHGLGYIPVGGRIYGIGGCTEYPLRDVRSVDVLEVR
jgi:hypothetical protein